MPSPDISEAARTITDNLNEAMRVFGRARHNGEVHDFPGVSMVYCGLDAAFNAAVLSDPVCGRGGSCSAHQCRGRAFPLAPPALVVLVL